MCIKHILVGIRMLVVSGCLLVASNNGWAIALSAADMYLDPSAITPSNYTYDFYSTGYTATFSNVKSLKVLPAFTEDGITYYAAPAVGYVGDITGTNGSIAFNVPGPYFVQATYVDNSQQLFDYGIDFQINPATTGPTYKWKKVPTPTPDVAVISPDLKKSAPQFGSGTTKKDDLTTWNQVTDYLKTLTNKHVELEGHGSPGKFYWDGTLVLDDSTQSTKDWLASMVGHVNNLTLMACSTAAGNEGTDFLQGIANTLGKSAGYTDVTGGNSIDYFINDDGTRRTFTAVPEPASIVLVGIGGMVMLFVCRRVGRQGRKES